MKADNVQSAQATTGKKQWKTKAPEGGLVKTGPNSWKDDRYEFKFSKGELLITDTTNGTTSKVWGDPHLWTGDGDKLGFHKENLTLDLKNGTKITLVPTEPDADGVALLDKVSIMTPKRGIVVGDISGAGPKVEERSKDTASIDALYGDGNVLVAGDEVDDWFKSVLAEITGTSGGGDHVVDGIGGNSGITFETRGKGSHGLGAPEAPESSVGGTGDIKDSIKEMIREVNNKIGGKDGLRQKFEEAKTAEEKQLILADIQAAMQQHNMLLEMLTNLAKTEHEGAMSIVRNLRLG